MKINITPWLRNTLASLQKKLRLFLYATYLKHANKTKPKITEKQQQYYRLIGLSVIFVLVLSAVMYYLNEDSETSHTDIENTSSQSTKKIMSLASALDTVTLDDRWLSKEDDQLQSHDQLLKQLQAQVKQLAQSRKKDQEHAITLQAQLDAIKAHHEKQLHALAARLNQTNTVSRDANPTTGNSLNSNPMINAMLHANGHRNSSQAFNDNGEDIVITRIPSQANEHATSHALPYSPFEKRITPTVKKTSSKHRSTPEYLPAGTFAKGIMLGGLDAATDLSASNNPRPVLLKIIDQGELPNHQHAHIKGCVITAAGMGDVSSERGYIRLERLSCVRVHPHQHGKSQVEQAQTREIIDVPVFGTVFGPSGQDGVRGTAVYRAKQLVSNSFAAGLASGFGKALQDQSMNSMASTPYGMAAQFTPAKTLEAGAANGVNTALDRLAEYYIKRAERYHPIVQIHAGTLVDVVFLKGVLLQAHRPTQPNSTESHDQDALF